MRVLLAIHNAYSDPTSGAARCVRTILRWLEREGHECRALATARFDGRPRADVVEHLEGLGVPIAWSDSAEGPLAGYDDLGVGVTMLLTRHNRLDQPNREESLRYLGLLDRQFESFAPELVLTYGGHPVVLQALRRSRRRGAATAVYLANFGYEDRDWFRDADLALACSRYLAAHYARAIGLHCVSLGPPIDWSEAEAEAEAPATAGTREFVTFVNPMPHKGAAFFARLAAELGSRRPDIPMLVVQSASDGRTLARYPEADLRRFPQILAGPATQRPADFLALTRILLVPSVCAETLGRVAVEAMIHGIPPLVSDRGALPETVADAGRVLAIPDWMTPETDRLPTSEEVAPWFQAVCELWDDSRTYAEASARARATAERLYGEGRVRRAYLRELTSLVDRRLRARREGR